MLNGMKVSQKLEVARQWYRGWRGGQFEFTEHNRNKFEELLEDCQHDAMGLEATAKPAAFVLDFKTGQTWDVGAIASLALRTDRDAIGLSVQEIKALAAFAFEQLQPQALSTPATVPAAVPMDAEVAVA